MDSVRSSDLCTTLARSSSAELLWTTSLQLCDQPFHGLVKHRPSSTLVPSPAASLFCKMWLQPLSCCWGEMLDLLSTDTWHASVVQGCGGPLSRTSSHLSPSPSLFLQPASSLSLQVGNSRNDILHISAHKRLQCFPISTTSESFCC